MKPLIPEIKGYFVTDIDDIENCQPEDPEYVNFWLSVTIRIKNQKGADNFEVQVVTQKQLSQIVKKKHMLIIPYYEGIEQVIELLDESIQVCKDFTAQGMLEKIAKMYQWEYDNYKF